jgi:hypothetical protein
MIRKEMEKESYRVYLLHQIEEQREKKALLNRYYSEEQGSVI